MEVLTGLFLVTEAPFGRREFWQWEAAFFSRGASDKKNGGTYLKFSEPKLRGLSLMAGHNFRVSRESLDMAEMGDKKNNGLGVIHDQVVNEILENNGGAPFEKAPPSPAEPPPRRASVRPPGLTSIRLWLSLAGLLPSAKC